MLPFLPALILLIVHGPANVERMACRGELPAMLHALNQQIKSDEAGSYELSSAEEELMLASLLSISNDQQLSLTILKLLRASSADVAQPSDMPNMLDEPTERHVYIASTEALTQGFLTSQKSRDGPVLS